MKPIKSVLTKKSKDDVGDETDATQKDISNLEIPTSSSLQIDVTPVDDKPDVINELDDSIKKSTETTQINVDTVPFAKETVTNVAIGETEAVGTLSNYDSATKVDKFLIQQNL